MSTPLEVIQGGAREFEMKYRGTMVIKEELSNPKYGGILSDNKTNTLALLQALHDELEGNKLINAGITEDTPVCDNESCSAFKAYNKAIQDQQDNLQALMDSMRV